MIAGGQVSVNGAVTREPCLKVDRFMTVALGTQLLQQQTAHYFMLHKPAGYLSATSDPVHPTVMELLPESLRSVLHIGGRLDRNSSGLLILTNDGQWSRRLTEPGKKIPKTYRVKTARPISPDTRHRFAEGIYFPFEGLTTSPAELELLDECEARLTIYEGRYHQVKRMFHATGNHVTALHRESMGEIRLDKTLEVAARRPLTAAEIASIDC